MALRYAAPMSAQNSSRSGYTVREIALRPPRMCAVPGEGMVNFGVRFVACFRNVKCSTMIGARAADLARSRSPSAARPRR
jgi:hypothetical protein